MRLVGAVTAPGTEPTRSLRTLVNGTLVVVGLALVAALVMGAVSFSSLTTEREDLVETFDPAVTATARLRGSTGDQQSGVRGFSLTGDRVFLEPWDRGRAVAAEELRRLRALLTDTDHLRLIDRADVELQRWQRDHAEMLIAEAADGRRPTQRAFADSRVVFERARSTLDELSADLDAERADARTALIAASQRFGFTLVVVAVVLVTLIAAVAIGLRRLVLAPIVAMVGDARRISGGDLDHVPSAAGLDELAALGSSLDQVRVELVRRIREVEAREAELGRSNAELEQFAYVASHDLQEPLRKVASFCQMLQRRYHGQLDERADTYIEYAVDGATRMQELINDLLAFSRVGRTTERFEAVDLEGVLDDAERNLSTALDDAGGEIRRSPMPQVMGDRSLLVALFQNLVGNGLKFRGPDRPVIAVHAEERDDEWEFTVTDNGIGIPEEYRERIFVIFQRLHSRNEYPGTGIGLSLCRKIVEFHGGRIDVEERPDATGTVVRFTLGKRPAIDGAPELRPHDTEVATTP